MSVKYSMLALLYEQERHGYEIKIELEQLQQARINPGQIYTTLDRLIRDELVIFKGEDDMERKVYSCTDKGKLILKEWLIGPVTRSLSRDDFPLKYILARKIKFPRLPEMIANQRKTILNSMMNINKKKTQLNANENRDVTMLLEGLSLHFEADLKWLDLISEE